MHWIVILKRILKTTGLIPFIAIGNMLQRILDGHVVVFLIHAKTYKIHLLLAKAINRMPCMRASAVGVL